MIEEELRRFVKQRTTRDFRAARDFDEAAFHQCLQNTIDSYATHCFDIGARDRLPISYDGQSFERGRTQARWFGRGEQSADPLRVLWIARQLPAVGFFHQLKSVLVLDVFDFQLLDRSGDFCLPYFCEVVRRKLILAASMMENIDNLFGRERFLRAE